MVQSAGMNRLGKPALIWNLFLLLILGGGLVLGILWTIFDLLLK